MRNLTLHEVEEEKSGPIYVLNVTRGEDRSNIVITVPKVSGTGLDIVEIPATFIPICITDQVARRQLLASSEFRRAVTRGMITIIHNTDALELLEEDGVVEEVQRLKNLANAANATAQVSALEGVKIQDPATLGEEGRAEREVDTRIEGVAAGVKGYMTSLLEGESNETETLNSLRSLGQLEAADYKYVGRACKDNYPRITTWAKRQLNNLKVTVR